MNTLILREIVSSGPKSPSDIAGESGDDRLFDLTPAGLEKIFVIATLDRWLARAPGGPISFGPEGWEEAIEALVRGWSTAIVHMLAAGPRSLAELDRAIDDLNFPILERHVEAMANIGQLELVGGRDEQRVYAVTDWLREGVAPLVAASCCEQRDKQNQHPPIAALDVEAAFQLALPLLELPEELSGSCQLTVLLPRGRVVAPVGVAVQIEAGRVVSCAAELEGDSDTWASGDVTAWFRAVIDGKIAKVKTDGKRPLARCLVEGLHDALFGDFG